MLPQPHSYACASYRRNTNYIRVPTTVIGLIDASVSIKVAVNYGNYKNRLGAYHAPMHTFLDFTFLRTLPTAQIRNGFAELIKISSCAHLEVFNLLDKYCESLIEHKFGRGDGATAELKQAADVVRSTSQGIMHAILTYLESLSHHNKLTTTNNAQINREGIHSMLKLETPNLHEIGLDRVIAYGHTWSPLHELVPATPLRHGHAISVDMAFSATVALLRGLLSAEEHSRLLTLFSRAGLSIDHPAFDEDVLRRGTAAILKTRDGKLRLAVPHPLGKCVFVNEYTDAELALALRRHKEIAREFPRGGAGLEAYVDSSDTGYEDMAQEDAGVKNTVAENGAGGVAAKMTQAVKAVANGGPTNGNGHANGDGVKKVSGVVVEAVGTANGVH